jgi:EmrB/QacA subfamily drug resistance transporter
MAQPEDPGASKPLDPRGKRLPMMVPIVIAFAFLMEQVDSTVIVTAIPQMAQDLGTTVLRLNLAVTAYILTLAVFIPVSGWLADRFGARRMFVAALTIFTVSSALCGFAESLSELVFLRCLQGLGGAMMTPVGRLILLRSVPRSELVTAMFYVSLPALIGPVIGPLLGGFLTSYASWRWIFYINVPFGIVGIALALIFLKETRGGQPGRLDLRGFLLAGAGLALMQLGIENSGRPVLPAPATYASLAAAVVLLVAFFFHARRHPAPVLDLSLFRLRSFRIGSLVGCVSRIGINAVPFLLPLMLQLGFGLTPFESGALTFFISLGSLLLRTISSRGLRLFGFDRVLTFGSAMTALLIGGFALLTPHTPHWAIAGYVVLFGIARTMMFMATNTLAFADTPDDQLSRATSLAGVVQQLSISFGVTVAALLLGWVSEEGKPLTVAEFHDAFLLVATLPLIAILGFARLRPEDGIVVSGHRRNKGDGNSDH